ncbi:protein SGT1 A [Cladorrhinum sp. PSN332]|nr:protein SGT1 A [Cladorrhinum sp. PSN332]
MSATTQGQLGLEAVKAGRWEAAIPLLDKALESSNSPAWLLARSQAHQQLKNYDDALHDAELAYHSAAERSSGTSRKQMLDAQHRRSVILFRLHRYADADCCAKWAMLLAEGRPARENDGVEKQVDANGNYTVTYEDALEDKAGQPDFNPSMPTEIRGAPSGARTGFESEWARAYAWRSQVLQRMKTLPENDPGRKVTVTKIPIKPQPRKAAPKEEPVQIIEEAVVEKPKSAAPAPGSVPDDQLKLRTDFYQTSQNVTVTLFVKDASKENIQVQFSKNHVQISGLPRAPPPYVKPGDREASSTLTLGGEIVPSGCRFSVTVRKIELVLQKATPGTKWSTWGTEEIGLTAPESEVGESQVVSPTTTTPAASTSPKPTLAPAYPTSSRTGPKNWEKVGDDEDDQNKDDINGFFKALYKDATPDQQRAMMKSFIESNGTALSTDWKDVANRTVETVPPEGVEAKRWKE